MYKLILIDDETIILSQLKKLIDYDELGFTLIETFSSAIEGLEYIEKNQVDAIIADIKMPKMDGLTFAKIVKEDYPHIQVALMSAYRDFEYAQTAMKYKVSGYVVKPIIRSELIATIKGMYDNLSNTFHEMTFNNIHFQVKCQKVFSDLFCGITTNIGDLMIQLNLIDMPLNPASTHCTLINIHINDFNAYINSIWKYEKTRLYNAIGLIISFDTPSYYSFVIRYVESNIEILILHKIKDDKDKIILEFMQELKERLNSILNIFAVVTVVARIPSVLDIMKIQNLWAPITDEIIHNDTINKAVKFIKTQYASISSVDDVAKFVNLSPVYFGSYFKHHMKESFTNYLNKIRIQRAKEILLEEGSKIFSVSDVVGYKSVPYFYKTFKNLTNLTPAQYKANNARGVNK